jgi:hypothetical protein
MAQNKADRDISSREVGLLFCYRSIYEQLYELQYGIGLRSEIARSVEVASPQLNDEEWIASVRAWPSELEEFVPKDVVDEDWANRAKACFNLELAGFPEPVVFERLMRANAARTVRKIVGQSVSLKESRFGNFLLEQPNLFLRIKASQGFPRSIDRRIDFLARSIAAVVSRYRPSTGRRYLAKPGLREICEHCGVRRAVMDLDTGEESYAWCGAC